jgi:ATP-dependent Lhr-like helicase
VGRGGHAVGSTSVGKVIVANAIDVLESAAIIMKAAERALERRSIEENALDVLANQICAMAIEYRRMPIDKICAIVGRASPYQKLGKEGIVKIVKFMEQLQLLRFDGKEVMLSRRAMDYFFKNISVIPDTRKFTVKNFVDNKKISVLDEAFVSNYVDEESTFITKGLPWKVVSIEEDTVIVEPAFDQEAAIPDWEGEDIPVSYGVSNAVYEMLGSYKVGMLDGIADQNALEAANRLIADQRKAYSIKDGVLFIEDLEDYIILNTPMGKLANEFLARAIGAVATLMTQSRISAKATPYSVIIDVSGSARRIDPKKLIVAFSEYSTETLLKNFIVNSELFRYKFIQVAKLFGIIDKKAAVTKSAASRLIEFYKDSAAYEETFRDLKKNYFDIAVVEDFREKLRKGEIKVEIVHDESPLSEQIFKASYRYRELVEKLVPKSSEIDEFARAVLSKSTDLICTYCGFRFGVDIGKLNDSEKILCPACDSPMVGTYVEGYENIIEKRKLGKQMSNREKETLGEMLKSASLVDSYGRRALIALATYGVGLETATRVLRMLRKDFNTFIVDLINAQRTFIKTKRFWAR